MGKSYGPWAKIKRGRGPGAFVEVAFEVGVGIIELGQLDNVVEIKSWGEYVKGGCRNY